MDKDLSAENAVCLTTSVILIVIIILTVGEHVFCKFISAEVTISV